MLKTVNWNFLKLIIQKLHGIYLMIFVFINLIFISLYMNIEKIKKNDSMEYKRIKQHYLTTLIRRIYLMIFVFINLIFIDL